jgi:hypothetical protein
VIFVWHLVYTDLMSFFNSSLSVQRSEASMTMRGMCNCSQPFLSSSPVGAVASYVQYVMTLSPSKSSIKPRITSSQSCSLPCYRLALRCIVSHQMLRFSGFQKIFPSQKNATSTSYIATKRRCSEIEALSNPEQFVECEVSI